MHQERPDSSDGTSSIVLGKLRTRGEGELPTGRGRRGGGGGWLFTSTQKSVPARQWDGSGMEGSASQTTRAHTHMRARTRSSGGSQQSALLGEGASACCLPLTLLCSAVSPTSAGLLRPAQSQGQCEGQPVTRPSTQHPSGPRFPPPPAGVSSSSS